MGSFPRMSTCLLPLLAAAMPPSIALSETLRTTVSPMSFVGAAFEATDVDQSEAQEILARAEAALYLPKLRRIRWLEHSGAATLISTFAPRPERAVSLPEATLQDFEASLELDFPGYRDKARGPWLMKHPSVQSALSGALPPNGEVRVALATAFSEGFEGGLGAWSILSSATTGGRFWGVTSCDRNSGSSSADAVRGGAVGSTLGCTDTYPPSLTNQLQLKSCLSIAGASEAWLDVYIRASMDASETLGFYFEDPANPQQIYGYGFSGNWDPWVHLVFNLKQWYALGDLTAVSCARPYVHFGSDASVQSGWGARVDDVTVRTDAPPFLRCSISANPTSGSAPLAVSFSPNVGGATGGESYQWSFGDTAATTATTKTASFTYTSAGDYSARLRVVDTNSSRGYAHVKIHVNPPGACSLSCSATVPSTATAGTAVTFQGGATPAGCTGTPTYSWTFGDGQNSNAQSPSHTYASAGTYPWTLTASIAGASPCTKNGTITVSGAPAAKPGDCDGDGAVSVGEVQRAINMLLGAEPAGCGVDTNGDGRVTADEVQRVINAYLGGAGGVSVTVSPASVSLAAGGTQQFTAAVSGSSNTAVTWSVQEGASGGSITSQGLYTAPATGGTYHVVATSQADPTKKGTATVTVAGTVQTGVLLGTVRDTQGTSLGDVAVGVSGKTTRSNAQGYFTIDGVPASDRALVSFSKSGYVPTTKVTKVSIGQGIYLDVYLSRAETSQTISAGTGGTVSTTDGGSAQIPANGLVDGNGSAYTGQATVAVTTFDPTNAKELAAFPGKFEGLSKSGETIPFVTFGFMDVTVTGSGGPLQLAQGKTATLRVPVPQSILSAAPATLPEWYFDPSDGKWHEEGTFTLKGNVYEGTVPHLSIWNCDVGSARCRIEGHVVDTGGNPVKCATVTMMNLGPRGRFTSGESCTPTIDYINPDNDGWFTIPVDANSRVEYWAEKGGTQSDHAQTDTCPSGGTVNVGNIVLGTYPVKITLVWGANPSDLDAHMAVPKAGGGWAHIYYPQSGKVVEDVKLDTDDQSGYGPEIFSVYKLHPGTYRYSVYHFDGTGNISTSGASVSVLIEGVGIYNYTPPSGATGEKDVWRVFDLVVDQAKKVTIRPIGDILHNKNDDDASVFTP